VPGSPWSKAGLFLNLISAFPVTTMGGLGLGWLLDRKLDSSPWFTLGGFLLGLGAGFSILYQTVKAMERKP